MGNLNLIYPPLLVLLLTSPVAAAELKVSGQLDGFNSVRNTLDIIVFVENKVDRIAEAHLKYQIKKHDDEWTLVEDLEECNMNITLEPLETKTFSCNYTIIEDLQAGEYKVFVKADIVNGTYSYTNLLFEIGEEGFKEKGERGGNNIQLSFIEAPAVVKTGELFNVTISLKNNFMVEMDVEVYSYVFKDKRCFSFGGWKGNAQKISLKPGDEVMVVLENFLGSDTESGNYTLRARARYEKDYDVSRQIEVVQQPFDIKKQSPTGQIVLSKGSDNPELFLFVVPVVVLAVLFSLFLLRRRRFL